jgi:hypothetical protein
MVKLDAVDREASGKPVAAEVNLYLSQLAASVVEAEEITDLYAEAGIGQLDLTQFNEEALRKLQTSETPHLAVEALRLLIEQKMREVTRYNIVRQGSFAERLENLMILLRRRGPPGHGPSSHGRRHARTDRPCTGRGHPHEPELRQRVGTGSSTISHGASWPSWSSPRIGLAVGKVTCGRLGWQANL